MRMRGSKCMRLYSQSTYTTPGMELRSTNSHIKLRSTSNKTIVMANSLLEFKAMKHTQMRIAQKLL
jgi:hypothetical protein